MYNSSENDLRIKIKLEDDHRGVRRRLNKNNSKNVHKDGLFDQAEKTGKMNCMLSLIVMLYTSVSAVNVCANILS